MRTERIFLVVLFSLLALAVFPVVVWSAAISVSGKAKVINTDNSYLDFTNYNSNVALDDTTGDFSGYAFLEDVGWLAFGTTDNSLGPVNVNLTSGVVSGKAKSLNTGAYLDFTNYSSNVSVNVTSGVFTGFAFSEDVGWINFADTGVSAASALDADPPLAFGLDSPGEKSYTNAERPIFKWMATTDAISGVSGYGVEVDNGDTGGFTFDDIPTSRTTDYETAKYYAIYENFSDTDSSNDRIAVYSKSTNEWGDSSNDGKLKEGKRIWKVKARDGVGNERIVSGMVFVDRTVPSAEVTKVNAASAVDNMATVDTTPMISGRVSDVLAGDKESNRVASGPESVEVRIERRNVYGLYDLHSLATVGLAESYWSDTNEKITDNSENKADKYAEFSFTPQQNLPLGSYKISVTGRDAAGNVGATSSMFLRITTVARIVPEGEDEVVKEIIKEAVEEAPEVVIEVPAEEPVAFQELVGETADKAGGWYWRVVGVGRTLVSYVVDLSRGAYSVGYRSLVFVGEKVVMAGRSVGGWYNALAQRAPESVGGVMLGLERVGQSWVNTIASAIGLVGRTISDRMAPVAVGIGDFAYKQEVKLVSIAEILFDENPTVITKVKVIETGKDYAVISWETNHYTKNNKINYGETLSYGEDVLSQERAKNHEFRITGLKPGTKYFFEVMSQNKNYVYDAYHEFVTGDEEAGDDGQMESSPRVQGVMTTRNSLLPLVLLAVLVLVGWWLVVLKKRRGKKSSEK